MSRTSNYLKKKTFESEELGRISVKTMCQFKSFDRSTFSVEVGLNGGIQ
jgi:hypothetical protein